MSTLFPWTCPYCERAATITDSCFSRSNHRFNHTNKLGDLILETSVIVCPNPSCSEYAFECSVYPGGVNPSTGLWQKQGDPVDIWRIKPDSMARHFPDYIPTAILEDYRESCAIRDLSPKASATLSRRCLQGMIRDYWKISKKRLVDEIDALDGKIDKLTWDAIDAVRKIGNIGAHMEKDIDLMLDVDPAEAGLMIGLIESLLKDWYVARHDREQHLAHLKQAAVQKATDKKGKAP